MVFDWLGIGEKETREGILIRYNNNVGISEAYVDELNNNIEQWSVVGVKKNDLEHILFVSANNNLFQLNLVYNDDNDWYELNKLEFYTSPDYRNAMLDKIEPYVTFSTLILKPIDRKIKAHNAQNYTLAVFEQIAQLKSYDSVIEEEQRAKKEKQSIEEQLEMWNYCIEAEMKVLDDTPFFCNNVPHIEKKNGRICIDIPIAPYIIDNGEHTLVQVRNILQDESIEQDSKNLFSLSYKQLKLLKESGIIINSIVECKFSISCANYETKNFKRKYRGTYDLTYEYEGDIAELTIDGLSYSRLEQLFKDVNNSLYFTGTIKEEDIMCNGVSITSRREETKRERAGRIELLEKKEMLFGKLFIGTLNWEGSDYSQLRIFLPKEKEEQEKIVNFLQPLIESGELNKGIIKPNLGRERAILKRERTAVNNVREGKNLKNERMKEFIFNSSKASPTLQFLNKEITHTQEFMDCQKTALLSLNSSQQSAIVKALYAEDLCLLQGPPGTGKTTVIAELLWQHIRKKQDVRIMLTSQTNLAIDNALSRLLGEFANSKATNMWRYKTLIKPLRIADEEKLSEEGMPFTSGRIDNWVKDGTDETAMHNVIRYWMDNISDRISIEESDADAVCLLEWKKSLDNPNGLMRSTFAKAYKESYNIMGMTCGKVDSPDFSNNRGNEGFDVVIMDEASKCTPPELIMPLRYARKSIVIGDHRQLPPVILDFREKLLSLDNERAKYLADKLNPDLIETSQFKRLITNPLISPTIKATFNLQYRMHQQINDVIEQFYAKDPGGLQCGLSPMKVNSTSFDERESRYHGFLLPEIIDSNKHVLWIDVPDGSERKEGTSFYNEDEVKVVESFLMALRNAFGFKEYFDYWRNCNNIERTNMEGQIGVISFYAPQVERLNRRMQSLKARFGISTRTDSVDNFQGQEQGIVIVSTVRTNHPGFARSPERLNVALSRARRLLVIVGNSQLFSRVTDKEGNYIYRNVIDKIKQYGGFIDCKDVMRYA